MSGNRTRQILAHHAGLAGRPSPCESDARTALPRVARLPWNGDHRAHSLAGEGMPHEDDPPLVARHAESPVGDRTDLDLDQLAHERGAADDWPARTGIPVPSAP